MLAHKRVRRGLGLVQLVVRMRRHAPGMATGFGPWWRIRHQAASSRGGLPPRGHQRLLRDMRARHGTERAGHSVYRGQPTTRGGLDVLLHSITAVVVRYVTLSVAVASTRSSACCGLWCDHGAPAPRLGEPTCASVLHATAAHHVQHTAHRPRMECIAHSAGSAPAAGRIVPDNCSPGMMVATDWHVVVRIPAAPTRPARTRCRAGGVRTHPRATG